MRGSTHDPDFRTTTKSFVRPLHRLRFEGDSGVEHPSERPAKLKALDPPRAGQALLPRKSRGRNTKERRPEYGGGDGGDAPRSIRRWSGGRGRSGTPPPGAPISGISSLSPEMGCGAAAAAAAAGETLS
jgi:hypothetical protein